MRNAYNTTDPKKLLGLKRLEADALLDVLRTINQSGKEIDQMCLIVRNVLIAQLGVKKMIFKYQGEKGWIEGIRTGFKKPAEKALTEMRSISAVSQIDEMRYPALAAMEVGYVIPLNTSGLTRAYFLAADFADSEMETQSDLIFIETIGNILAIAIQNKLLFEEKVRKELLQRELEVAETIQRQLLISEFDAYHMIDVYAINIPHHHIGGDFYDLIIKGNNQIFVCIADVAGKGISAALLMSYLQAHLRALCAQYEELDTIIRELNSRLYSVTNGDRFVSLFLGKINLTESELHYVNAGHNYPVFLNDGLPKTLDKGSLLLGVLPDIPIQQEKFRFYPDDILFLYTDGVSDQHNVGNDLFGIERLQEEIIQVSSSRSRAIVQHVQVQLQEYAALTGFVDDITMLCLKFYPA